MDDKNSLYIEQKTEIMFTSFFMFQTKDVWYVKDEETPNGQKFIYNDNIYRNMKYYYDAREYIFKNYNFRRCLACLDGFLLKNIDYIFDTKEEAYNFCCYITVQRKKYNLFIDKDYIFQLQRDQIRHLILYYDYIETWKWSTNKFEILRIEYLVNQLVEQKILKNYLETASDEFISNYKDSIENVDIESKYEIRYLSKVTRLVLFRSAKYNKNIYLFGEFHGGNVPCNVKSVDADKFIDDILKFKSFFKDLLFELWYGTSVGGKEFRDPIRGSNLVHFESDECLEKSESKRFRKEKHIMVDKCKNYRIEPIDIRQIQDAKHKDSLHMCIMKLLKFFISSDEKYYVINTDFHRYINKTPLARKLLYLLTDLSEHNRDVFVNLYISNYVELLRLEIYKCYLKDECIDFFMRQSMKWIDEFYNDEREHFIELKPKIDIFIGAFDKPIYDTFSSYGTFCKIIGHFLTYLLSLFTDTFTISKMFKKMKHDEGRSHGPDEYRNIMYLGGDQHVKHITLFLSKLHGFTMYNEGIPPLSNPNCIDLRLNYFEQPFFYLEPFYVGDVLR